MHLPRSKIARPGTAGFRIVFARNDTRCKCVFLLSSPAWRARTNIEHNQQSDLAGNAASQRRTRAGPSVKGQSQATMVCSIRSTSRKSRSQREKSKSAWRPVPQPRASATVSQHSGWLSTATHEQRLPSPKQTRAAISAACTVMYSGMAEHLTEGQGGPR